MALASSMHGASLCAACTFNEMNLCATILNKEQSDTSLHKGASQLMLSTHTIPARRIICHPKEWSEDSFIICKGWAASSIALPDGRRQIIKLLLPGDLVFTDALFEPMSRRSVEAISEVTYRKFNRARFKDLVLEYPELLEKYGMIWSEERARADDLTLDLGRRKSDERIARLILDLAERLTKRGMMSGQVMEFPLRQRHVADATGLTTVHVSKVLGEFQRAGLIDISVRSLTINNMSGLRQVVGPR